VELMATLMECLPRCKGDTRCDLKFYISDARFLCPSRRNDAM